MLIIMALKQVCISSTSVVQSQTKKDEETKHGRDLREMQSCSILSLAQSLLTENKYVRN